MKTKFYLLTFILIILSSCDESWEYEFIKAFMSKPENILDYARKNELVMNKSLKEKLNTKLKDDNFAIYVKRFRLNGYKVIIDKTEMFYKKADSMYKEESHRITLANENQTECISFFFGSSVSHKISGIYFSSSLIEPQGIDSRTNCEEGL